MLSAHQALSGDVDGAFRHVVHPGKALAAAVGDAGIRVICQGAADAGTLHEHCGHAVDYETAQATTPEFITPAYDGLLLEC